MFILYNHDITSRELHTLGVCRIKFKPQGVCSPRELTVVEVTFDPVTNSRSVGFGFCLVYTFNDNAIV